MKLYAIVFATIFVIAGCSSNSNDDDPVLNDPAVIGDDTTGDDTTGDDTTGDDPDRVGFAPTAIPVNTIGNGISQGTYELTGEINLTLNVFDAPRVELFWERVTDAVSYKLFLENDAEAIAETVGTSVTFETERSDFSWLYSINAYDANDALIASMNFSISPGLEPPLMPSLENTLAEASNIFSSPNESGETTLARLGFDSAIELVRHVTEGHWLDELIAADTELSQVIDQSNSSDATVACINGGTLFVSNTSIDEAPVTANNVITHNINVENCQVGAVVINGALARTVQPLPGSPSEIIYDLDNTSWNNTDDADSYTATGEVKHQLVSEETTCGSDLSIDREYSIENAELSLSSNIYVLEESTFSGIRTIRNTVGDGSGTCSESVFVSMDGLVKTTSDVFGGNTSVFSVEGYGLIVDGEDVSPRHSAQYKADFGDTSLLSISWLGLARDARVDLQSIQDIISFRRDINF